MLFRSKDPVGDVELVYVPKMEPVKLCGPADLFGDQAQTVMANQVDVVLGMLMDRRVIAPRPNKLGRTAWGDQNKLAVHVASGIPGDLFATTRRAWWGYVVCRTGSADNNTLIASTAKAEGWQWHPYDGHFTDVLGRRHWIETERDAFALVGLPYKEPWER